MSNKSNQSKSSNLHFTRAFKLEAVELTERGDRPIAQIARSLGVKRELRYAWRDTVRKLGVEHAFRGRGRWVASPTTQDDEIAALRRELAQVKEARDILKRP